MSSKIVFDEIRETLANNGSLSQHTRDRLIMLAMSSLNDDLQEVCKELKRLKELIKERNEKKRYRIERLIDSAIGSVLTLVIAFIWLKVTGFTP